MFVHEGSQEGCNLLVYSANVFQGNDEDGFELETILKGFPFFVYNSLYHPYGGIWDFLLELLSYASEILSIIFMTYGMFRGF